MSHAPAPPRHGNVKETLSAEEWQEHIAALLDEVDFDSIADAFLAFDMTWWEPEGQRVPSAARIREQCRTMLNFAVNFRQGGDRCEYGGVRVIRYDDSLTLEFVLDSVDSAHAEAGLL